MWTSTSTGHSFFFFLSTLCHTWNIKKKKEEKKVRVRQVFYREVYWGPYINLVSELKPGNLNMECCILTPETKLEALLN